MSKPATSFKVGDRVRLRRHLVGLFGTDETGEVRGLVVSGRSIPDVVQVAWPGDRRTGVLATNLIFADRVHLEPV